MTDSDELKKALSARLVKIEFDERYYRLCDLYPKRGDAGQRAWKAAVHTALERTALGFSYNSRESFFAHTEDGGTYKIGLNVAYRHAALELILVLQTAHGNIGGPFTTLARAVALCRDAAFARKPPYPQIQFSSEDELDAVASAAVDLYRDVRWALTSERGWLR